MNYRQVHTGEKPYVWYATGWMTCERIGFPSGTTFVFQRQSHSGSQQAHG